MFESDRHRDCVKRKYHWLRGNHPLEGRSYYYSDNKPLKFQTQRKNASLDIQTKKAVLKASSSVVALSSYSGEQELAQCCGVIIENDSSNHHTILTSARLIRCRTEQDVLEDTVQNVLQDKLADNLKVIIYLYDGSSYEGHLCAYDFHYNIAWIQFHSDSSFPSARMRQVDDYINVNPAEDKSSHLRPYSSHFNLIPGHAIVTVGRYFTEPFDLMAAPGEFVVAPCDDDFGCKELLKGTCSITQCGDGGALINLSGEVIGITFYVIDCFTPFLPIQIAQKCWEHYKRYGRFWRPCLGIVATNLYAADISHIEKVIHKIPSICNGVLVEEVIQGSSLDSVGLHENDVIVQCDGKTVHSFLEFSEMVWEKKVGDVLQLAVVRVCENEPILVDMVVNEVGVGNFNHWPRM